MTVITTDHRPVFRYCDWRHCYKYYSIQCLWPVFWPSQLMVTFYRYSYIDRRLLVLRGHYDLLIRWRWPGNPWPYGDVMTIVIHPLLLILFGGYLVWYPVTVLTVLFTVLSPDVWWRPYWWFYWRPPDDCWYWCCCSHYQWRSEEEAVFSDIRYSPDVTIFNGYSAVFGPSQLYYSAFGSLVMAWHWPKLIPFLPVGYWPTLLFVALCISVIIELIPGDCYYYVDDIVPLCNPIPLTNVTGLVTLLLWRWLIPLIVVSSNDHWLTTDCIPAVVVMTILILPVFIPFVLTLPVIPVIVDDVIRNHPVDLLIIGIVYSVTDGPIVVFDVTIVIPVIRQFDICDLPIRYWPSRRRLPDCYDYYYWNDDIIRTLIPVFWYLLLLLTFYFNANRTITVPVPDYHR